MWVMVFRGYLALLALMMLLGCTTSQTLTPNSSKVTVSDPLSRARVHTELAALYYQQGSMKTALEELAAAIKVDPQYPLAYSMLGLVYMQLGESPLAEQNFQRAIALAPNDPDIRNNFGLFLCDTGQYAQGLAQLDRALANPLYNTPARALMTASRCAEAMGNAVLSQQYRQKAALYVVGTDVALQK